MFMNTIPKTTAKNVCVGARNPLWFQAYPKSVLENLATALTAMTRSIDTDVVDGWQTGELVTELGAV